MTADPTPVDGKPTRAGGSSLTGSSPGRIAALGVFDGIHLGHRRILDGALEWAKSKDLAAIAVTFSTHPDAVVHKQEPKLIVSLPRRVRILESMGFDATLLVPFTEDFARMSPESFAEDFLLNRLGVTGVIVGPNFRFGHRAAGDVERLAELGEAHGFGVRVGEELIHPEGVVSSSLIRKRVEAGDVDVAGRLLGRPFHLRGQVVLGQQRGRSIGFPTVNLAPETRLRPGIGVYTSTLERADGSVHPAVTNVGVCPTFGAGAPLTVETHILDFDEDLYGEEVAVAFHARLRGEQRFEGPDALMAQIARDIAAAREHFRGNPSLTEPLGNL